MKNKAILLVCFCNALASAQEGPSEDEVVMINPKAPEAMVYVHKEGTRYIGLEGDGSESVHSFVCKNENKIPDQNFYSEKFLLKMECMKYLYDEPWTLDDSE